MPTPSSGIPAQRLPAPSLFVAPPSRNASNIDLGKLTPKDSHFYSSRSRSRSRSDTTINRLTPSAAIPGPTSPLSDHQKQPGLRPPSPARTRRNHQASSSPDRDSQTDQHSAPHVTLAPPDPRGSTAIDDDDDNQDGGGESNHERRQRQQQRQQQQQQEYLRDRRPTAVLDAHWAALQSTLSDIELSASGTTSHVFGNNHAAALEDLRKAQVELARAWGPRGSAGQVLSESGAGAAATGAIRPMSKQSNNQLGRTETQASRATATTATTGTKSHGETITTSPSKSSAHNKKPSPTSQDKARGIGVSAKATEADLDAAEQRRKESDAYFKKVKESVEEVVNKLEDVSKAMRNVEMESREIWGHGGSEGSTDLDSSGSVRS